MKKLLLLLLILSGQVFADSFSYSMEAGNIKGVSIGYAARPILLFGTKSGQTMFPMHLAFFTIDGFGDVTTTDHTGSSNTSEGVFGGMGAFVGFSAMSKAGSVASNSYLSNNQYHLLSLDCKAGDFMAAGLAFRFMAMLPFSSDHSIISSYFNTMLELGYMGLKYNMESGAFNEYEQKKENIGGIYVALTPGFKFYFVEIDLGVGMLFGLYKTQPTFKVPDNDGRDISNKKDPTNHFLFFPDIGLTFDLCKLGD